MASAQQIERMGESPPPGVLDLSAVVRQGQGHTVTVMGVVSDFLPPAKSRGTDFVFTFTICDRSPLAYGMKVRVFSRYEETLPQVRERGDVVLLRNLRITSLNGGVIGLFSHATTYIIFPRASIPSTEYKTQFGTTGDRLPHIKSPNAQMPTLHHQQWAISLSKYVSVPPAAAPRGPSTQWTEDCVQPVGQDRGGGQSSTTVFQIKERQIRDKFSRIKDIECPRGSPGNFYDLVGDVVKMYSSSFGHLELYLCDYTVNNHLHDYTVNNSNGPDGNTWKGPVGKRVLRIELQPPHASWALDNIKEGEFVFLQNVRIKWNQKGTGTELEGNMWPDNYYPDKICVHPLSKTDPRFQSLLDQRSAYQDAYIQADGSVPETKTKKRKRAKERAKAKAEEEAALREANRGKRTSIVGESRVGMEQGQQSKSGAEHEAKRTRTNEDDPSSSTSAAFARSKTKVNPYVTCQHPNVPLSTFDQIIKNPGRRLSGPEGAPIEAPFTNVMHHAVLRVTDFYPHDITSFCAKKVRDGLPGFEWSFWLVLASGDPDDDPDEAIDVLLEGHEAEDLLGLQPTNLKANKVALETMRAKLFTLWGDLEEQKDKFLRSHPDILPDEDFSAKKYNLKPDNRPFHTCIMEYGIPANGGMQGDSLSSTHEGWIRLYKLFGTSIT